MKIKMFFSVIAMTLLAINFSFAQDSRKTITAITPVKMTMAIVGINGMVYLEGCADKISKNLKNIEGVASAVVSFKEKKLL